METAEIGGTPKGGVKRLTLTDLDRQVRDWFVDAAKARSLPVQYVEFEGQGHHIEGLALQAQAYQVRFDFLRAVAEAVTKAEGG